ncbi:hypothetical protein KC660_00605 [Candidatus Dojkabacteria bacterium]|uniref:Uncharacterized protein n=1 Tax=Candidatus Dojkabacteria bacterium TaxID=2099670 RepID=A0A955L2X4_9BACT|nr:hypothetical protein [Candidatus Dojkabacteria bacterium]
MLEKQGTIEAGIPVTGKAITFEQYHRLQGRYDTETGVERSALEKAYIFRRNIVESISTDSFVPSDYMVYSTTRALAFLSLGEDFPVMFDQWAIDKGFAVEGGFLPWLSNPIATDLLLLLNTLLHETATKPGDEPQGLHTRFISPGEPKRYDIFESVSPMLKLEDGQGYYDKTVGEVRRMIPIPEGLRDLALKTMFVLARTSEYDPQVIRRTLDCLNYRYHPSKDTLNVYSEQSIALLQIMDQLGLINDPLYKPLALELGRVVIDSDDFKKATNSYTYGVLNEIDFWEEAMRQDRGTKKLEAITLHLSRFEQEARVIKNLKKDLQSGRTNATVISQASVSSRSSMIEDRKAAMIKAHIDSENKRAQKNLERTNAERIYLQQTEAAIRSTFLMPDIDDSSHQLKLPNHIIQLAVKPIILQTLSQYATDPILSSKARRFIENASDRKNQQLYDIQIDRIILDPFLGKFLRAVVVGDYGDRLTNLRSEDPSAFEFIQRYITYKILAVSSINREDDFLFLGPKKQENIEIIPVSLYYTRHKVEAYRDRMLATQLYQELPTYEFRADDEVPVNNKYPVDISSFLKPVLITPERLRKAPFDFKNALLSISGKAEMLKGYSREFVEAIVSIRKSKMQMLGLAGLVIGSIIMSKLLLPEVNHQVGRLIESAPTATVQPARLTPDIYTRGATADEVVGDPRYYAKLVYTPDEQPYQEGDFFAYAPLEIKTSELSVEADPIDIEVQTVEDLRSDTHWETGDMVLQVPVVEGEVLYPLSGWDIKTILTESPNLAVNSTNGGITINTSNTSSNVAIVYERKVNFNQYARITSEGFTSDPYVPIVDLEAAQGILETMESTSPLYTLYSQLLQDLEIGSEDSSELVSNFLNDLGVFIQNNTHYQLGFVPEEGTVVSTITKQPQLGFECDTASQLVQELMAPVGITTAEISGTSLYYNSDGQLWTPQYRHVDDLVMLPNGEVLYVRMVPPVTTDTSAETLDALVVDSPNWIDVAIQNIAESGTVDIAVPIFLVAALVRMKFKRETKEADERVIELTKPDYEKLRRKLIEEVVTTIEQLNQGFDPDVEDLLANLVFRFLKAQDAEVAKDLPELLARFRSIENDSPTTIKSVLWLINERIDLLHQSVENAELILKSLTPYNFAIEYLSSLGPNQFKDVYRVAKLAYEGRASLMRYNLTVGLTNDHQHKTVTRADLAKLFNF